MGNNNVFQSYKTEKNCNIITCHLKQNGNMPCAGSSTTYHVGDSESSLCRYGNVGDKAVKRGISGWKYQTVNCDCDNVLAAKVKSYQPNDFGLYDMHGNVWELTQDCWNDSYKGAPANGQAWTSGHCGKRVVRGGAWNLKPYSLHLCREWHC